MILYAVIARAKDGAVLVESAVAGVEGNFPQIAVELLNSVLSTSNYNSALGTLESSSTVELLPDGARRTFIQRNNGPNMFGSMFGGSFCGVATQWNNLTTNNDMESNNTDNNNNNNGDMDYYFHMSRKENIICLCISDDTDVRYHQVNYDFLKDIDDKFTKTYAPYKITKAKAYEMDKKFKKELGKLLYFYNENRKKFVRGDVVNEYLGKIEDIKTVVGNNITMVMEREATLSQLVDKTDQMLDDSKVRRLQKWMSSEYVYPSFLCLTSSLTNQLKCCT